MSAEIVRQLCEEKQAAEKERLDLECLFAHLCGRHPDVVPGMLRQAAQTDGTTIGFRPSRSNDAEHTVARLKRDDPDLAEQVASGGRVPVSAEIVRQLIEEKQAAEKARLDLECLFAHLCGRHPDVVPGMLRQAAGSGNDWMAPVAAALLAKLKL